ncbi:MAG TPA: flagellar basal body protein, partial [Terriglobales bacterium]
MESGIYAACSALVARTQQMDILANNLANVDTTG